VEVTILRESSQPSNDPEQKQCTWIFKSFPDAKSRWHASVSYGNREVTPFLLIAKLSKANDDPGLNWIPLSAAAPDLVKHRSILLAWVGRGKFGTRFTDEIEKMPSANFKDRRRSRAHQHKLFEQKVGESVLLGKRGIWRLELGLMRPAPVLNQIDATGLQQRKKDLKRCLCFLILVGCIVDNQIKLIRKFIPNDMLENLAVGL
jgi:hypothetical protein